MLRLILASASPRRAELLRAAGFDFDIVVTDVDEAIREGEPPQIYVRRLAAEKSAKGAAIAARPLEGRDCGADPPPPTRRWSTEALGEGGSPALREPVVVAADTAVVVDGEILAKPHDDEEAAAMLRRLSGRTHQVMTGVSLRRGADEAGRVVVTDVQVAPLTAEEVAWYVASGEGRDKAGAYAIQGLASRFIPRIDGSYSNVVGLPLACVYELLAEISATRPR